MRKAGLLDRKPLTATRTMLDTARRDTGTQKTASTCYTHHRYTEYKTRFYFRAAPAADKEILEVDLFTRKDLADGRKEPRFRIFLDHTQKDFASWDMVNKKWSSAKIDMLETGDDRFRYSYRGRSHAAGETLRAVNRYLETGLQQDVETAVLDFQTRIRACELKRKHRLVTDAIDGYMAMVPEKLPADWMKFINDRALEHSIFYQKEKRTGYCTHCRLHVPVSGKAAHNMPGKCSLCGYSVVYKSWKKQKHISFRTAVSLIQKCTDGRHYVYRQFRVDAYAERSREYVPEIHVRENCRMIFCPDARDRVMQAKGYEWGEFRNTGIARWCEAGTVSRGGWINHDSTIGYARSVPYTGNLKKLFKDTCFRYIPAVEIMKSMGSRRINVMAALGDMQAGFPYEAFWKMGLRRFVQERIDRDGAQGLTKLCTHPHSRRPWEYLGLAREDLQQAVRLDAADRQLRVIQLAAGQSVRLTDEQAVWFDRHTGASRIILYTGMQTPHRIIRYMEEKLGVDAEGGGEEDAVPRLWIDYLDMACRLGWDLRDRDVFFPQDVRRAHDEAVILVNAAEDRKEAERLKERDRIMRGNAEAIREAFCYQDDRYMIFVPECYSDFRREGNTQHNCVATYFDRAVEGECIILFIRKCEKPDESFCTAEIYSDRGRFAIRQNRAAYNREAPEDVTAFLQEAVRQAQKTAERLAAKEAGFIRVKTAG